MLCEVDIPDGIVYSRWPVLVILDMYVFCLRRPQIRVRYSRNPVKVAGKYMPRNIGRIIYYKVVAIRR